MLKRGIISVMVVLMMVSVASARELEDVEMPEVLTVEDTPLVLNGAGVRNVMFLKFYVGGLYLKEAVTDAQEVMDANEPMAIRLHLITDVKQQTMKDACIKGFEHATDKRFKDLGPLKDRADRFLDCFSEPIKEGDVFNFKYHPATGLKVYKFDELLDTMEGVDFKAAMFGIWLNDNKPADKGLKEAMLAGDVTDEAISTKDEKLAQLEKEKQQKMADAEAAKKKAAAEKQKAEEAAKKKAAAEKERAEKAAAAKEEAAKEKAEEVISKDKFVSTDINFALNSNNLSKTAKQELDDKAAWLKANADVNVVLEGHSDARGPKDLNYRLAKQRAQSVKDYMVKAGIDASRMEVKSYGEEKPLVSGDNKEAWTKNRRVHFRIVK